MKPLHFGHKYAVLDHLATGGMAEVYRARYQPQSGFSKTVVIKKILSPFSKNSLWRDSFLNEAKIMARLSHSNIVQTHDFGKARSGYFLSMEYVEGGTLADLKRRAERVPKNCALYIGLEMLKGLSYAHKKGVLHRDLSPSNVLISKEGEVKITDFGIAQLLSDALEPTQFLKGKYAYMSPEQKLKKPLTPATDLYSLSVILYELMTAKEYEPGADLEECFFLKQGLCEDPKARIQTGETFERLLQTELSGIFVSQRSFAVYLSGFPPWRSSKTLALPDDECGLAAGRPLKPWRRWVMGAAAAVILSITGGSVPEFYARGFISLNVEPWGEVYIGERHFGVTPMMNQPVPTGRHSVVVANPELNQKKTIQIQVEPNQLVKVHFSLK